MGTSPVVDRSALGNSVSALNLEVLSWCRAAASDVEENAPDTPKVCLAFATGPDTDTTTLRPLPIKMFL